MRLIHLQSESLDDLETVICVTFSVIWPFRLFECEVQLVLHVNNDMH